jgi:hypothetical protein
MVRVFKVVRVDVGDVDICMSAAAADAGFILVNPMNLEILQWMLWWPFWDGRAAAVRLWLAGQTLLGLD